MRECQVKTMTRFGCEGRRGLVVTTRWFIDPVDTGDPIPDDVLEKQGLHRAGDWRKHESWLGESVEAMNSEIAKFNTAKEKL